MAGPPRPQPGASRFSRPRPRFPAVRVQEDLDGRPRPRGGALAPGPLPALLGEGGALQGSRSKRDRRHPGGGQAALARPDLDVEERLSNAFEAAHGHAVGEPGSEHMNELLETATDLVGPVRRARARPGGRRRARASRRRHRRQVETRWRLREGSRRAPLRHVVRREAPCLDPRGLPRSYAYGRSHRLPGPGPLRLAPRESTPSSWQPGLRIPRDAAASPNPISCFGVRFDSLAARAAANACG